MLCAELRMTTKPPEKPAARNPVILPERKAKKTGCPKCGHPDYDGRMAFGAPVYICKNKDCGNVWHGGIIHEQGDPRIPYPPSSTPPPLEFDKAMVRGAGNNPNYINPETVEIRRRVDPTPAFRRGARISDDDEEA